MVPRKKGTISDAQDALQNLKKFFYRTESIVNAFIYISAVLVGLTCIATGQWIYLIYVIAVLFAITNWKPSWLPLVKDPKPDTSISPEQAKTELTRTIHWGQFLLPACVIAFCVQVACFHNIVENREGMITVVIATVALLGLVGFALHNERRVVALKKRSESGNG